MAKRPIRIANCSGAHMDAGYHMLRQATAGPVDAITGDYLAEMNIANNAQAMVNGNHPGYEKTALDGILLSLDAISQRNIKVVVNGGALNPRALAVRIAEAIRENNYQLKVAWVEGDDYLDQYRKSSFPRQPFIHLDASNPDVKLHRHLESFFNDSKKPIVSANAYLGARGIYACLENGADIVICGRVSDASPVIGLAQWWHGWKLTDYDSLAGALLAGHLIECSGYITGSNFCDFTSYPLETFIDIGYGIAEIDESGACVITKHDELNGIVNEDTVKSQLLYELQGKIYLNSDVKADLKHVSVSRIADNRVQVSGAKGFPPPPTTKLAVFYLGGYQGEIWIGLTGTEFEVACKRDLIKAQVMHSIATAKMEGKYDELEFQLFAGARPNAEDEFASTTMLRIFVQAPTKRDYKNMIACIGEYSIGMQHVSGLHVASTRTLAPQPFLVYYPALILQSVVKEVAYFVNLDCQAQTGSTIPISPVSQFEPLGQRESYDSSDPVELSSFGPTIQSNLGSVALARSGDKGGNMNIGFFVRRSDEYAWLKSFLSRSRLQVLLGKAWHEDYFIERCEFPNIMAVHFVVYGILGRGVSSSIIIDSLGKGFADFLRSRIVDIPERFVARYRRSDLDSLTGKPKL